MSSRPGCRTGRTTARTSVAIAVEESARPRLAEVVAACRALGLRQTACLTGIGVFTGSVELHNLPKLRTVRGVLTVELKGGE